MKTNTDRLIDAVQKEWDDYPNINEIANNRLEKIHQETEFDGVVERVSKLSVKAIVSLIAERERLKEDRDKAVAIGWKWEQAKYDTEDIKDKLLWTIQCLESRKDVSIVNDWTDMCADDKPPKMIKIDDWYYAFIKDEHGYALWINDENDDLSPNSWGEVSDLTCVPVWVYQELKSYAVAIGWKTEDQDLFI